MYLQKAMQRVEVLPGNLENHIVFQPLLSEVISETIETLYVVAPIRRLAVVTFVRTP